MSGYADYSLPLAWYGCFEPIHVYTGIGVTDQNNTLFHCAKSCGNKANQYQYIGMDRKYCYCFESIDKHNPSCQKGHQSVRLFHLLSEYCLEPFQCYSYIFDTPNTDSCVKCSAKLRSVCTSSNVNSNITHHCNDTTINRIIQKERTWQKSGQHYSKINRRLLPYPVPEKNSNIKNGELYWLGTFRSFIARADKRYETTNTWFWNQTIVRCY